MSARPWSSYLTGCEVAAEATVGPTYLRPDARIGEGAKAGSFVEIKNSRSVAAPRSPSVLRRRRRGGRGHQPRREHDHRELRRAQEKPHKDRQERSHGVDTTFVAPVEVGDDAYTGAGSVITEDVPPGALGISRAEQKNVEGYAAKKAKEPSEGDNS